MASNTKVDPRIEELLKLPWTIELVPYEDGSYFARVKELPGCMTEASTRTQALDAIEEAQTLWLESAVEHGDAIPQPASNDDYSGKIFVRTSPRLHREVAEAAESEGVSMSQWVAEVLARVVGVKDAVRPPKPPDRSSAG